MLTCPVYKAVVNSDQMMGKKNHFTTDQIPNLILLELSAQKKRCFCEYDVCECVSPSAVQQKSLCQSLIIVAFWLPTTTYGNR